MRISLLTALWQRIYGLIARDILNHWSTEDLISQAGRVARLEDARRKFLDDGNEEAAEFLTQELARARRADSDPDGAVFVQELLRNDAASPGPCLTENPAVNDKPRQDRRKRSEQNALTSSDK